MQVLSKTIWYMMIKGATLAITHSALSMALEPYAWSHRPIILSAPQNSASQMEAQFEAFQPLISALSDRHIALVKLTGNTVEQVTGPRFALNPDLLRRQLGIQPDEFTLVLVGKDAQVKFRSTQVVDPNFIFSIIDAMPMRQLELRKQNQSR